MHLLYVLPKNAPTITSSTHSVLDIDVTSHSGSMYKALSPFYLGKNCKLPDGRRALNVENAWQYSKVYDEHLTSKGNIKKSWFEWSQAGFDNPKAVRYPMGKGAVPKFSYYAGERLGYIDARKQLYIPLYAYYAAKTREFKVLQQVYDSGETIIVIRDFDAYDHHKRGMSWDEVINNPHLKMGHGFVLAMALALGSDFYRMFEK